MTPAEIEVPAQTGKCAPCARSRVCSSGTLMLRTSAGAAAAIAPAMPAASFELVPTTLLTLVAVGLTVGGLAGINRRDIG